MNRSGLRTSLLICFVLALALCIGCGGGPAQGEEGGECYGNDTCNTGLECVGGVCVVAPG